jgi:hypothetical protein
MSSCLGVVHVRTWLLSRSRAHAAAWCVVVLLCGCGGTVGMVVFRQPSCATWSHRDLRHRLLISRGSRIGVGSRPRSLVVLLLVEPVATIPSSKVVAFVGLDSLKSQGHCRGSHLIVGGVVHLSRQTIFGQWVSILAAIARRCCLLYDARRRNGV